MGSSGSHLLSAIGYLLFASEPKASLRNWDVPSRFRHYSMKLSQGWIVGFGTTLDGRINAFLAIPVGVTADSPGGPDAPVFDSGAIVGTAWFGVGWFCPPNLWHAR
jgi:hypothetical protein